MLGIIAKLRVMAQISISDDHTVPAPRTKYERFLWEGVSEEDRDNIVDIDF
jgi:hypothetical protein